MIDLLTYIDPGTTVLIWQILAGVFITLGVVIGIWWTKISTFVKTLWVKIFRKKQQDQVEDIKKDPSEDEEL